MENEKKIKLDELPDAGSEPEILALPVKVKSKKAKLDPRLENLKNLNAEERIEAVSDSWRFERPGMHWGWLVALVSLIVLERMRPFEDQPDL
ncbi:MAG: hypothetical protein H0V66_15390, partial [Bdellovibrionales bacterium]|nr:hypothetical protein [Bdellovibrionales bacterium]